MTNKQKIKILLKAAELIAEEKETFACFAIETAMCSSYRSDTFVDEFCEFYGQCPITYWLGKYAHTREDQNTRVLLLLTFAESLK